MAERRLGQESEPPQDLSIFAGRSRAVKAITTPLEVDDILAAYSRWCGDDVVDDAFAKAERRLAQGLRAQSSAA